MHNKSRIYTELISSGHPLGKMAFVTGPRQVGKTTLVKQFAATEGRGPSIYLNYDIADDRRRILKNDIAVAPLLHNMPRPSVIFDEIHKMRLFKRWLKGFFDQYGKIVDIIVTGSGRLDLFQKGGDSLLGRYFLYHVHPLSAAEVVWRPGEPVTPSLDAFWAKLLRADSEMDLTTLTEHGGFPEPFLANERSFTIRWQATRRERVMREDVRDLTRIIDIGKLDLLIDLLNPRVGAPLSVNNLRQDLEVAFETARSWLATLERIYYVFGLTPWSKKIARGLQKERKLYFWDWSEVSDHAARFENLIVSHFAKAVDFWNDAGLGRYGIYYIRDKQKRETDLLLTSNKKPALLVEVKLSDRTPSPSLLEHARQAGVPMLLQVVSTPGVHDIHTISPGRDLHVVSAGAALPLLV